jgi:hypothetical protein
LLNGALRPEQSLQTQQDGHCTSVRATVLLGHRRVLVSTRALRAQ